jgi:hypothetical protein
LAKLGLVVGFVAATTVSAVFGREINITVIEVDENGHLLIAGNPGPPGVRGVDPISGSPALVYSLPFAGNPGDLLLFPTNEPPQTSQLSDIVRFEGDGNMYFFSLQHGSNDTDLADVPVLPPPITPNTVVNETGSGALNRPYWIPFGTGIGGDPTNPSIIYLFPSEIPEPSTVILVGLGPVTLLAIGRRRQRFTFYN